MVYPAYARVSIYLDTYSRKTPNQSVESMARGNEIKRTDLRSETTMDAQRLEKLKDELGERLQPKNRFTLSLSASEICRLLDALYARATNDSFGLVLETVARQISIQLGNIRSNS